MLHQSYLFMVIIYVAVVITNIHYIDYFNFQGHTHLSTPATVMTDGNNISQMLQSTQQVNPSYNNDSCIIIVIVDILNTASSRDLSQPDGILTATDSSDIDSISYTFNRESFESVTNGQSE